MKPVERATDREPRVLGRRVRAVPYQSVDPVFVRWQPAGIEVADDGGSVDEVRPVETFFERKSGE